MPSRVIRGEILKSVSLSMVSVEAEFFFWRLLIAVDEWGRIEADPHLIRAELYARRPQITAEDVERWMGELCALDPEDAPIQVYTVGRRSYLHFPKWEELRGKSNRGARSKIPDPPADTRGRPRTPADTSSCSGSCSGVGSGSGESVGSGSAIARSPGGNPGALTDVHRTDLDADPKKSPPRIPPARTADTPEDPAAAEARALAHAAAQQWQADRLAFAPRARECQPGEWSILEPDFSARLVPHALGLAGELLPCLKWAMADVRSGSGFPGWRTVLRSPQKVLEALQDGAMVEQWRAATATTSAPIRREQRDPRRGVGYGATAEQIAADAIKYAGGRASR